MSSCEELTLRLQNTMVSMRNNAGKIAECENYICSACGISEFNCEYLISILRSIYNGYESIEDSLEREYISMLEDRYQEGSYITGKMKGIIVATRALTEDVQDIIEMVRNHCESGEGTCTDIYRAMCSLSYSASGIEASLGYLTLEYASVCS